MGSVGAHIGSGRSAIRAGTDGGVAPVTLSAAESRMP